MITHGYKIEMAEEGNDPVGALRDLVWQLENPMDCRGGRTLLDDLQDGLERIVNCAALHERGVDIRIVRTRTEG